MNIKIIKKEINNIFWLYHVFFYDDDETEYLYLDVKNYTLFLYFEKGYWEVYKTKNGEINFSENLKINNLEFNKVKDIKTKSLKEAQEKIESILVVEAI